MAARSFPVPLVPSRTSLLADLVAALPQVRPQMYFKSSLVALCHAMEDLVLTGQGRHPVVFANFQKERYYRQEAHRYQRIHALAEQVYVLAAPETNFHQQAVPYETVALDPSDPLAQEWHLIVIDELFTACLICRERQLDPKFSTPAQSSALASEAKGEGVAKAPEMTPNVEIDAARQFEGYWSFDPQISLTAAQLLLTKILAYRPDLEAKLAALQARLVAQTTTLPPRQPGELDQSPFAQRLMTYLQAGQYKLQRTYRALQLQEQKERLVNQITQAIRQSLDPEAIFQVAVQELGKALGVNRCLLYRCRDRQTQVVIEHEYTATTSQSLAGQVWPLQRNPLLAAAMRQTEPLFLRASSDDWQALADLRQAWNIAQWLVVPVHYQGRLLGMIELHRATPPGQILSETPEPGQLAWLTTEIELVQAIAPQVGVALIQAEAYQNLDDLNHQLANLDQAKSDLIAVTGHELRTPLSTIQVCLESLATEPDMPPEIRQVMLDTALQDSERLRHVVQDFLTLSRLDSGRIDWHVEPLPPEECVNLSLSSINARRRQQTLPTITLEIPPSLPMVNADGEWLVEVLSKILDNACKFTPADGRIWIRVQADPDNLKLANGVTSNKPKAKSKAKVSSSAPTANGASPAPKGKSVETVRFSITDNGRGIDPDRLGHIFERFYQGEGSLRRTVGGTGLGLAICRKIVESMGGKIWAESAGTDQGSTFHFTLPAAAALSVNHDSRLLA